MRMPEERPLATIAQSTVLGVIGGLPGMGGIAGALQGVAQAAANARLEDWWAMVAARLSSLEVEVQRVASLADPEFVSALHRLTRAAQETADDDKRSRLAAALAHSGSWSSLPIDDRERMERLVTELSSREVKLLKIIADPRGWLEEVEPQAIAAYEVANGVSFQQYLDAYVSGGNLPERAAVRSAIEALQVRSLAGMFESSRIQTGSGVLESKATGLGWEFVHYLERILA